MKNQFKTLIINAEIAVKHGYPAAIMLHHISYWVEYNKLQKQCKKEGVYWMYRTYEDLASEYPGLTYDNVRTAIKKLIQAKLIFSKAFFVKNKKVNHYRLTDEGKEFSANFRKEKGKLFIDYNKIKNFVLGADTAGTVSTHISEGGNPQSIYRIKNINKKIRDSEESRAHAGAITKILSTFAPLGTEVNYGNTTERAAALRLIKKCGEEQAIMFAEQAVRSTQANLAGDKYAPLIKNAYMLEQKLINLASYLQRPVQNMASIPESWRSILED